MTVSLRKHQLVVGAFLLGVVSFGVIPIVIDPLRSIEAQAQTDPLALPEDDQTSLADPALDAVAQGESTTDVEGALPATPVPPATVPGATSVPSSPPTSGSMETSLGGSDIAVSSVGGSYEVDAPKRRGNKSHGKRP
jgi:hypothetical protein